MNEDTKLTAKTALFSSITNIISISVGLIAVLIIAKVLSTEDIGIASNYISIRNFAMIIVSLASYTYINKAMIEYKNEKFSYMYTMIVMVLIQIIALFVFLIPFRKQISNWLDISPILFMWLFISIYLSFVYSIYNYYCIFSNKYKVVTLMTFTMGAIAPMLSVFLSALLKKEKYIGRIFGLDITYIIFGIFFTIYLFAFQRKKFDKKYILTTYRVTIPLIPHVLSQMILTQSDIVMIKKMCGDSQCGIYSMGHTVGNLALMVSSQFMTAWSPWVYRRLAEKKEDEVKKKSKYVLTLGTYISIGLITISQEIIHLCFPREYEDCIYIVPLLVLAMYFQFVYVFFYDIEYYYKKSSDIAKISFIVSVLNIVLNYFFINKIGYIGACYSTIICYFFLVFFNALRCRKLNISSIYNIKFYLLTITFIGLYTVSIFEINSNVILKYSILVLITILIICFFAKEFNGIKKIIKEKE